MFVISTGERNECILYVMPLKRQRRAGDGTGFWHVAGENAVSITLFRIESEMKR